MLAIWNDAVIAESDDTVVVEGNHYFPPESIKDAFFEPSDHQTTCPWKGKAHYYNVVVGEKQNNNAAWYYPDPKEKASHIKGHVAFWNGVEVVEESAAE
ncbi:MAG: DUF427 domain-containing protein [Longimonas sp.]|uniref:DUF427 domain-containing protein n=1 Tax=Longimonas sp. TaxID=2039626 RepID=UPI003364A94B